MAQSEGSLGVLNLGALEASLAQPQQTFGGEDLYPGLVEKAATPGFSMIQNHPLVVGNKRTGHAAMELFLVPNGHEIRAAADEQFEIVLGVAAGRVSRDALAEWLQAYVIKR